MAGKDNPMKTIEKAELARREPAAVLDARDKVAGLVSAFLSGRNERTLAAYRQDLEDFRAWLGTGSIDDAAGALFRLPHGEANACGLAYKAALLSRGLSPATINRRLAAIRSLVKLARTLGMVAWALEVENVKTKPYRDTRGPGRAGFESMLAAAGEQPPKKASRDAAILRLLHDLGLRRGELVALNVKDVDIEAGTVAVVGKGRREKETLSMPKPTSDALARWLRKRGGEAGPLFLNMDRAGKGARLTATSVYRVVRRLGERAGIETRPHGLRHTAITEACRKAQEAGFGIEEVLDFSRHSRKGGLAVLMLYRDRDRNLQGRLATLVAGGGDE